MAPPTSPLPSVVGELARALLKSVLDGQFPPGSRLPPERDLALRHGVARVSVRAALHRLIAWRVVATRQGSGATVLPRREWTADALAPVLRHALASGDLLALVPLVRDGLELRRSLVLDLVERAAGQVPRGGLDGARRVVREAWSARADGPRFVRIDREILPHLLEAAAMWPSLWLINSLAPSYLAAVEDITAALSVPASYERAHLAMLDAIEAGDGAEARRLFGAYLDELDRSLVASWPAEVVRLVFPRSAALASAAPTAGAPRPARSKPRSPAAPQPDPRRKKRP